MHFSVVTCPNNDRSADVSVEPARRCRVYCRVTTESLLERRLALVIEVSQLATQIVPPEEKVERVLSRQARSQWAPCHPMKKWLQLPVGDAGSDQPLELRMGNARVCRVAEDAKY